MFYEVTIANDAASTKEQALIAVVGHAVWVGAIQAELCDDLVTAVTDSTRSDTVCIGNGIAIANAGLLLGHASFGVMASLEQSVDFRATDGVPVHLIFLLVWSGERPQDQLALLSEVSQKLREI